MTDSLYKQLAVFPNVKWRIELIVILGHDDSSRPRRECDVTVIEDSSSRAVYTQSAISSNFLKPLI